LGEAGGYRAVLAEVQPCCSFNVEEKPTGGSELRDESQVLIGKMPVVTAKDTFIGGIK